MIEKVFEELGFFTEQTCKTLQKVMDGKSFYGLQLKYSNNAGNCTLFVQSDNDSAKPEELGTMFMNIALCELGQQSLKKFILETYIKESVGYERRLLFFMERNQYTAYLFPYIKYWAAKIQISEQNAKKIAINFHFFPLLHLMHEDADNDTVNHGDGKNSSKEYNERQDTV